jgi:hypothetical protein
MLRALFLLVAGISSVAAPASADRLKTKTVIRLAAAADRGLAARIRGQTSDIAVKLLTVRTGPLERSLKAQLETADRLAASRGAASVVWFDSRSGAVVVHVAESPAGKLFIRTVEPGRGRSSAMLETAAMMVRTALRAQVQGRPLGEDREVVLAGLRGPPAPVRPPPERGPRRPWSPMPREPEEEVPIRRGIPDKWLVGIGWQVGFDGQTASGLHGPFLSVQRVLLRLGYLGILAAPGVPGRIDDQLATIFLSRTLFAVSGGARLALGRGLGLSAGLQLGVAVFRRSTEPNRAEVSATEPSWTPSLLLAPELRIGWTWRRTLRLAVGGGVDYVPGAPVLVYESATSQDLPTHEIWRVQPRISLSVQLVLQ